MLLLKWETLFLLIKTLIFILWNRKTFIALQPHLLTISKTSTLILIKNKTTKIHILWKRKFIPMKKLLKNLYDTSKVMSWLPGFG